MVFPNGQRVPSPSIHFNEELDPELAEYYCHLLGIDFLDLVDDPDSN